MGGNRRTALHSMSILARIDWWNGRCAFHSLSQARLRFSSATLELRKTHAIYKCWQVEEESKWQLHCRSAVSTIVWWWLLPRLLNSSNSKLSRHQSKLAKIDYASCQSRIRPLVVDMHGCPELKDYSLTCLYNLHILCIKCMNIAAFLVQ